MSVQRSGVGNWGTLARSKTKCAVTSPCRGMSYPIWPQPTSLIWGFWQHLLNLGTIQKSKGTTAYLVQMAGRKIRWETCFDTLLIFSNRISTKSKTMILFLFVGSNVHFCVSGIYGEGGRMSLHQ